MYCSKACQRADWPRHKQECAYLKSLKLWPHVYRVPANELHCRPAALDACQAAKHKPRTDACNLCGGTENLETTECCGIVLCNHEHNYQVSSYSREFCTRSHRRCARAAVPTTFVARGPAGACHSARSQRTLTASLVLALLSARLSAYSSLT